METLAPPVIPAGFGIYRFADGYTVIVSRAVGLAMLKAHAG
jgi:hypothetical protein